MLGGDGPMTLARVHVMRCVDEYFNCLGEQANISHKKNVSSQRHAYTRYLASRPERPGLEVGE